MTATFYVGDSITVMNALPEKSVDLILTSPPFLALRSYLPSDHPDKALEGGSQATPGEYIDWLLDVVEACARVLAPHGSLCFELGDTYSGSTADGGDNRGNERYPAGRSFYKGTRPTKDGWPLAKSLSLIPESFRFAMVYGHNPHTGRTTQPWRLRNVIRWVRPNPPVGALGDKFRPATSELMVFCKAKDRFFDLDAVREPLKQPESAISGVAYHGSGHERQPDDGRFQGEGEGKVIFSNPAGAPPLDWWNIPLLDGDEETRYGPKEAPKEAKPRNRQDEPAMSRGGNWNTFPNVESSNPNGAPPLDWWNIPPGGYDGAHYAVFPKELLIKPIKAMCPAFVCTACGLVLASVYDQAGSDSAESLRRMRPSDRAAVGEVARGREDHAVLLGSLPQSSYGAEPGIDQRLDSESEGLHPHTGTATSNGESRGLRDAASVSDVGILGAVTQSRGSGSSQERGEGRQPVGEFGIVDEGGSRPITEAGTETPRVSSLWRVDSNATECPACGGVLRSGTVLDPFAGSGTTLAVATGHGRDAIGIDIDSRNFDLALDRVGPLILQRGEIRDGTGPRP